MTELPKTMTIDVKPNINFEGFQEDLKMLLLLFSEWLDSDEKLMRKPKRTDKRTHSDLVDQFIKGRAVNIYPFILEISKDVGNS